jgi:hypothetical protein
MLNSNQKKPITLEEAIVNAFRDQAFRIANNLELKEIQIVIAEHVRAFQNQDKELSQACSILLRKGS